MTLDEIKAKVAELIQNAFDAGVASVPVSGGFTQEQLDAAVAEGKAALKEAAKSLLDVEEVDLKAKLDLL